MNKEEYSKMLIDNVVSSILNLGGADMLTSIILTGSFGRGEPTWTEDEHGSVELKSDVEIALIRKPSVGQSCVVELIERLKKDYKEDLNPMSFNESRVKNAYNYNYTFMEPRYKTLLTFDLYNESKTVWGHDYLSEKEVSIGDVDPYEAKRLVANRIGELVYLTQKDNNDYLRKQWKGKLMLAIGSAWLILKKKYVSSYHGQYNIITNDKNIAGDLGGGFINDYIETFKFLRESGSEYEITEETLRKYVSKIDAFFENNNVGTSKVTNIMRWVKYFIKYVRTGLSFGLFGFENKILSSLISQFEKGEDEKLRYTALVWHNCIY
jgi:hypothetical protein